ncbi:hypothetical protein LXG23DRAFT_52640 [Yarrowia lipolytica]|nr:hypothetical protein LXG23DRAFT_52640 [Yarrowia lipolytica]
MSEDTKLRMKMERELELRRSNLDELKSRLNEQDAERHDHDANGPICVLYEERVYDELDLEI